jgi:hypothetical protein
MEVEQFHDQYVVKNLYQQRLRYSQYFVPIL